MDKYIPILTQKGIHSDGVIQAKNLIDQKKLPKHIDTALILFDSRPSEILLKKCEPLYHFIGASSIIPQYIYDNQIVLSYGPLGGPAAGGLIEELIAYGVKRFIACGSCGLIGDFDTSEFLLVQKAIRDEGLSYHYLEPSLYVETDALLNQEISQGFKRLNLGFREGITWTTDAFFKETKERIELRRQEGAVAVEMECASMAAVCQFRKLAFAQILYFSDIVNQDAWSGFRSDRHTVKEQINQVMIDIVSKL
jgi:uridine phosphorylase